MALLRAVNVGKRRVAMADLRALLESLGYEHVRTYVNSGNAVFHGPDSVRAEALEASLEQRFGFAVSVALRTGAQLERVLEVNPFPDRSDVCHVGFLCRAPRRADVTALAASSFHPEAVEVIGTEAYLLLPAGVGRSTLPQHVDGALGAMTLRNLRTVDALAAMARDAGP